MGVAIGLSLIAIGLLLLATSWRCSQNQITRPLFGASDRGEGSTSPGDVNAAVAIPLGVTAGIVALAGLAVLASGWDVIAKVATVIGVVALVGGLIVSWRTARTA